MIGTPPFKMIMRSLHHREKPITPRMIDTMPLISKVIAKPPDIPGIPGDAPGNPSWGKVHRHGSPSQRTAGNAPADGFNADPPAAAIRSSASYHG
ncbi:MAG: hypothetical protein COS57_04365, partial [Syntrophobacterales bacterium CG03_land_8_20_14_0_80_58_14]